MNLNNFFPVIISFIPLALGAIWKFSNGSSDIHKNISLAIVGAIAGGLFYIRFVFEIQPSVLLLANAILISGFCALLGQTDSRQSSAVYAGIMIVLGLSLGVILNETILSRCFLCGLLGYIASSLKRQEIKTFRSKVINFQITLAIIFSIGSTFMVDTIQVFIGLFLALTFLPLPPFHLVFVRTIKDAKGTLPSFLVVVWILIGLNELKDVYASLTTETLFALSLLAISAAIYATLVALVQKVNSLFVASVTLAHTALIWGVLYLLPNYSKWGIPFGVILAFVIAGITLNFSFIQQRYGLKTIGSLPGLLTAMPRCGLVLVLLVSFALFLPMLLAYLGLMVMPTILTQNSNLGMALLLFIIVFLGSGWYFIKMLHQTSFGKARFDVTYSDLTLTEFFAVLILFSAATYIGIIS